VGRVGVAGNSSVEGTQMARRAYWSLPTCKGSEAGALGLLSRTVPQGKGHDQDNEAIGSLFKSWIVDWISRLLSRVLLG
jgi:hypothetical protein